MGTEQTKDLTIRGMIESPAIVARIAESLPSHMDATRVLRIAHTAISRTLKLEQADKMSLLLAIITGAELGLDLSIELGHCYLVPFKKQVQLIVGYKGLIALAVRSGQVTQMRAEVVREGDHFAYELGLYPVLSHRPEGSTGDVTHAYAVAEMREGPAQFEVLTRDELDGLKDRSKSDAWKTDPAEMAKKAPIKRLCKKLVLSPEMAQAIALDNDTTGARDIGPRVPIRQPERISKTQDLGIEPPRNVESEATGAPGPISPEEAEAILMRESNES